MRNVMLERRGGGPLVGSIVQSRSGAVVEAMGAAGLDFAFIDMQHAPTSMSEMEGLVVSSAAAGMASLVRVASHSSEDLTRPLDTGASGIIVPDIAGVSDARLVVERAKFPPLGHRPYSATRDGLWGADECYTGGLRGYMAAANERELLLPQCETVGALDEIEAICATDGVDGIVIGPNDLSIAMGMPGDFARPEFRAALDRILAACRANGRLAIIFTGSEEAAATYAANGYDGVIFGVDLALLMGVYKRAAKAVTAASAV